MGLIVLDTNVVLYALKGLLAEPLPQVDVAISIISEIELLSFPDLSTAEAKQISELLAELRILPLDDSVKTRCINLRRDQRLKLPDGYYRRHSIAHGAELWTNDDRLAKTSGVVSRSLKLKGGL